ncbi:Uncharacterised protein [uncultured archaeon]|nr:Uncharacterised protein [uncultured archaeon]
MKYIALLRGINVGGNKKVDMKTLKNTFESLGFTDVSTYINSGNIIFNPSKKLDKLNEIIEKSLQKEFGFEIKVLIKTENEMKVIAKAIPKEWKNDSEQKSDVAYLFKDIDSKNTINELPIKKEFIDIRYVKGAIIWNVKRKDYNKSHINKIIGHKSYIFMTVRNINTARYLAEHK